jgi:hypothetical protein
VNGIMPPLSFRDRLLTPQGARAVTSPLGIVLAVVVAVVAVVLSVPLPVALLLGLAAWLANVWRRVPRAPRQARIDPFTLHDPWRRYVQNALQARTRFSEAVERAPAGPLRDRLREIAARVDTGVEESWHVAQQGEALVQARRGIDLASVDRQLQQRTGGADDSADRVLQSLQGQRATAARLDGVIANARDQLQVVGAGLDEAVARTLELSAHARAGGDVEGLGRDVDDLVTEVEALRQALEETDAAARGELPGGDTPRAELPGREVPGVEFPRGEISGGESPGGEATDDDSPAGETSGSGVPGGEVAGSEIPGGEVPGGGTSGSEVRGGEIPRGETSGGESR